MARKRSAPAHVDLKITEAVKAQLMSSVQARVTFAAEAAAVVDSQFTPHYLICLAALWGKPSPKEAVKWGAFGPAAVIDGEDNLFTNYLAPGAEGNEFVMGYFVGHVPDVVDVLSGICEAAGCSDEEAQWVLDQVFRHWVTVDKLRDPASVIKLSEIAHAAQFALKPGEKEKTEEQRDKDGY